MEKVNEQQGMMNADRESVVNAMCMTWRHDFGLNKPEDCEFSSGMTDGERDALRRRMGQLYDHHIAPLVQARASLPDGYMPIPTAEQLAEALENVGSFHEMSAELIAPELLANLLESLPVGVPDGWKLVPVALTEKMYAKCHLATRVTAQVWSDLLAAAPAAPTVKAEQVPSDQEYDRNAERLTAEAMGTGSGINMAATSIDELFDEPAPSLPAAGSADLTAVRCQCCATEYPHDSYDAGFIAGSGMCQVCDAAMPPKDLPAAGSAVEEPTSAMIQAACAAFRMDVSPMRAMQAALRAALSAQQSAPERVSVPKLAGLKSVNHQLGIVALSFRSSEQTQEAVRELRALLANHAKTGKSDQ